MPTLASGLSVEKSWLWLSTSSATKPTLHASSWPIGCIKKTAHIIRPRSRVDAHSAVMQALRGYSAPIPTPMKKRQASSMP